MNGFNKNVSDRCFTDTSKIVSRDNITSKWLKTIISSILLGEKTFYIAFRLIIKLFIISMDQHQGLLHPLPPKKYVSKNSNFVNTFIVFKVYKDFFMLLFRNYDRLDCQWQQDLQEIVLPNLASHSFQTATSYVEGHAFGKRKRS